MDVKSAFLNGVLEEEVYVEQPPGFMKAGKETQKDGKKLLFVALYVDDIIFMGNEGYAKDILKKSKMEECNPVATPIEPGTTCTRPDIAYSVGVVSQFIEDPMYSHWKSVKRIMRYLKGTESLGLFYSSSTKYKLLRYSDNDRHGDVDNLKSTSGYAFYFGDTEFSWASKKQPIVTLSTCKAELVAATGGGAPPPETKVKILDSTTVDSLDSSVGDGKKSNGNSFKLDKIIEIRMTFYYLDTFVVRTTKLIVLMLIGSYGRHTHRKSFSFGVVLGTYKWCRSFEEQGFCLRDGNWPIKNSVNCFVVGGIESMLEINHSVSSQRTVAEEVSDASKLVPIPVGTKGDTEEGTELAVNIFDSFESSYGESGKEGTGGNRIGLIKEKFLDYLFTGVG
ncbi:retrovirus-related pol polyprotein from transposon TNT 1-94 [Tanacetum coccineum]